jgi:tRNA (cmo5U34)-methyltransferase
MKDLKSGAWSFGGDVPKHFEEHISQSVPLYIQGHDLIKKLSDFFLKDKSNCYDIGCSTGNLLNKISEHTNKKNVSFYGIESEKSMHKLAVSKLKSKNIEIINKDVTSMKLKKSDLIISYYTLQFISPSERQNVVDEIYNSLNWGGAFIMFEKVNGNDGRFENILNSLYLEFKSDNKLTNDHLIDKARSLRGVLKPFSDKGNLGLLNRSGFEDIQTIMHFICFKGYLCIK